MTSNGVGGHSGAPPGQQHVASPTPTAHARPDAIGESSTQTSHSVAGGNPEGNPKGRLRLPSPRRWVMWTAPARAVWYALAVEGVAVAWCVLAVAGAQSPVAEDWTRFGVLAGALAVHVIVVWRGEERRRDRAVGPIFDLTSVWTFAAVVVLPAHLALLMILALRLMIYPIRRRPWWRYTFGTAVLLGSAAAGSVVLHLVGSVPAAGFGDAVQVAAVTAAAVTYGVAQALAHAGILTLTLPGERFGDQMGSRADNLIEAATLAAGGLLGVATATGLLYPVLILAVLCPINLFLADQHADAAELREQATTDPRTGLLNSRSVREHGERILHRCRAAGQPVSVAVIDLDYFKQINDTWGHPAGDAVLAATSSTLSNAVRPGDIVARDGGEEFILILPDTTIGDACAVAERVRADIARLQVPASDKNGHPVVLAERTASIGVAAFPDDGQDLATLLRAADTAVYEAKDGGRNQVVRSRNPADGQLHGTAER